MPSAEYQREWKKRNPGKYTKYMRRYKETHRGVLVERGRIRQRKYRDWMDGIKVGHGGCHNCGEKDPCCLDFHHRDPEMKSFNVGSTCNVSQKALESEIEKCDIVCANCHRKLYGRRVL